MGTSNQGLDPPPRRSTENRYRPPSWASENPSIQNALSCTGQTKMIWKPKRDEKIFVRYPLQSTQLRDVSDVLSDSLSAPTLSPIEGNRPGGAFVSMGHYTSPSIMERLFSLMDSLALKSALLDSFVEHIRRYEDRDRRATPQK